MPRNLFGKGNSKAAELTKGQVIEILELWATGEWTQGALARRFQKSIGTIGRIVRRESHQDITMQFTDTPLEHDQSAEASMAEFLRRQGLKLPEVAEKDQPSTAPLDRLAAELQLVKDKETAVKDNLAEIGIVDNHKPETQDDSK